MESIPGSSSLTQWIEKELVARHHVSELDAMCHEMERSFYQTMFEPWSHHTAILRDVRWTEQKVWEFVLVPYLQHVAMCDNGFHKIPEVVVNPRSKASVEHPNLANE